MSAVLRYTILRFLIFFGCVAALWLLGLRAPGQRILLIIGAAMLSMLISYFALKPFREKYSEEIAAKVAAHREAKARKDAADGAGGAGGVKRGSDEEAEDRETGQFR